MEECSVLIESTLPAEDKTSRRFDLPIDYELFQNSYFLFSFQFHHFSVRLSASL